jgi:hypothetical protein
MGLVCYFKGAHKFAELAVNVQYKQRIAENLVQKGFLVFEICTVVLKLMPTCTYKKRFFAQSPT